MNQDFYSINIAKRDDIDYSEQPHFEHYCRIEKLCADFIAPGSLNDFVADIRKAFAVIGEFKITVTCWKYRGDWKYRGETLEV